MVNNYLQILNLKRFNTTFYFILFLFTSFSYAGSITVTSSDASTAPVTAGATNQAIVRVAVNNPNGGGQGNETITAMAFKLANTNNLDITNAKLWYTGTSPTFATTTQLGATITVLTPTITFSGFSQVMGKGSTYYYWLTYDISPAATVCSNYVDAFQDVSTLITTSATIAGFTNSSTPNSRLIEGAGCWTYCTAGGSSTTAGYLSNVQFNTINRTSTFDGYINTGLTTTVLKTLSYNLTIKRFDNSTYNLYTQAWIDWNNDGDFADAGEIVAASLADNTANETTRVVSVTVPGTAVTGTTRMRVMMKYNAAPTSTGCDTSTIYMDVEDYLINIQPPLPCVTPTAQPTGISLTPAGSTIAGGFIAASPAADNYLVLVSTNPAAPAAPVNGTTYTIGSVYQAGYTVVDNDNNTTFTATGLTPLTTYYFYIYSFNSLCTGGPRYLGTSPLTGTTTTTSADYCTPTISSTYQTATTHHIRKVEFIGTLQDITNTSTFPTVAPFGYTNFTGLAVKAIQAKGQGVNIYMESPNSGYIKAWVDWNKDGDFLDAGETVYDAGGVAQASTTLGFIVPTGIAADDYRVRLRISGRNISGSDAGFSWDACSTNLAYYGEAEDYILRVIDNCNANIATVTNGSTCGPGTVNLNVTGTAGTTQFRWYANQTGGAPLASTASGTWTTPSISTTTVYWVTAYNGSCESLVRTKITAFVKAVPTLSFATSNTEVCGENSIVALTASGDNEIIYLLDENFESGSLGTFTNVHYVSNAAVNAQTAWQIHTSPYVPTGLTWYPAIASGFGANKFAFVSSDIGQAPAPPGSYYTVENGLVSNTVNSTGFLSLTFNFRIYFDRYFPDGVNPTSELMTVGVSTNGGTTWTNISGNITGDIGYGTRFTDYSYDLSAYINQPNLKVRIRYYTNTWANGAAVDDIQLFGLKPLNTALQWSGTPLPDVYTDAATTTPYIAGTPATTVYVKPNLTQLESGSYTFTATATLTNGCNVSQDITINNKSSIWKGTVNNDWNNPSNWSPAVVPTINSCVIIPTAPSSSNIIGASYNGFGKTLQVKNGGRLDIQSGNTLTIQNTVTVDAGGTFNLENASSLIQIDNVANSGTIAYKRNAITNSILDYVYWSTPVAGFSVNSITPTSNYRYQWIPTVNNGGTYAGNFGNWTSASGAMTNGKGYIIRGSSGISTFTGVPNNGNISIPILRGTYVGAPYVGPTTTLVTEDDDNWNLLGNPYPSAISADAFLTANSANLDQFVKVWTHGIDPSAAIADPFYQDFVLNYSVADYITYNALGGTQFGYDGRIAAGQGFFVLMNNAATTSENAIFNNSMRSNTYRNDQFYRSTTSGDVEKHRIWMKLIAPSGASSDALVGYATDALNGFDAKYDAISGREKAKFEIYSVINNDTYAIQGRSLPFDDNDIVPIGVVVPQNGIYTIALSKTDGLFENQNIYLEDTQLGIIYDIKNAPYTFMANTGRYNNRFQLRFTNSALNENTFENNNSVFVYANESLNIQSNNLKIKDVTIFDLIGRTLLQKRNVNQNSLLVNEINKTQSGLIINVTLEDGSMKTFKTVY